MKQIGGGGWIILGCLQAVALTGCGSGAVPNAQGSGQEAGAAAVYAKGDALPFQMPVRISRAFFENKLAGELRLAATDSKQEASRRSPVSWVEFAPTDPAPDPSAETGPVLADFRDHKGCAAFRDIHGVEVCFNIMGDVSNIGLNEREVSASGLDAWVQKQLGGACPGSSWNVRFVRGLGTQTSFTLSFIAETQEGTRCQDEPVSLEMTIRQI